MVEVVLTNFPSVFENFSKFSPIPSNIVAPPSDIVEISADAWKARFFLWKTLKTALKLLYETVTLYVAERPDLFPELQRDKHTNIQTKTALFLISCRRASTDLHRILHAYRGRPSHFCTPNFFGSDPKICARGPEIFGENCPIAVFCL